VRNGILMMPVINSSPFIITIARLGLRPMRGFLGLRPTIAGMPLSLNCGRFMKNISENLKPLSGF